MDNNKEIKNVLESIKESVHKLEQYNVTLDADIVALKDRVDEYREEIAGLNSLINTDKETEDTISKMQEATENMIAARKQLEAMEEQLADNRDQIEEENSLSKKLTSVFERRQEIYDSTQKVLDDYEEVKDTKYGAAALKAKVEIAQQKRNIVDENMQKALEKASEMGYVEEPEKTQEEQNAEFKDKLRLAQKIVNNRVSSGRARKKDLEIQKNVAKYLKDIGAPEDLKVEPEVEPEISVEVQTTDEPEETSEPAVIDIGNQSENTNDSDRNTLVVDIDAFNAKQNMAEYTEDELNMVREGLGKSKDEPLTEDEINAYKATTSITPQVPKKVIMIDKANNVIAKAIDGIKAHKALSAAVAIGAAVALLNPGLALGVAAVGVGADMVKNYSKGRSL